MFKKALLLLIIINFFSCKNEDDSLIIEPAGSAEYYINNKTEVNLSALITTSTELGSKNRTLTILNKQSTLIYTDGAIGVNPVPTNTFSKIEIYSTTNNVNSLLLKFSPVSNEDWKIIEQDLGKTGYGLTKYELLVTNEILGNN